jgi:outer membrane protein assembly factor BamB
MFVMGVTLAAADLGFAASKIYRFRGPQGSGLSEEKGLPVKWDDETNIVWKCALPGPGSSSPILVNGKIYLTCYTGYGLSQEDPGDPAKLQRSIVCVDRATGKLEWSKPVAAPEAPTEEYQGRKTLHGFATSTLATEGEQLYGFFGDWGVYAFALDGEQVWRTGVGEKLNNWGSSNSPVVFENLVIVNASVESGELVALDKKDGSVVWSSPGMQASWNTPIIVEVEGKPELVVSVRGSILGFDPKTGEKLWTCEGIQDYVCPSIVAHGDVVYALGGRQNTAIAVRAGGRGDVTKSHRLWKTNKGSNVSSPVYVDGMLYWVNESRGILYCLDAKTGEVRVERRLEPRPGLIYSSIAAADGKLYITSRQRGTYVLAAKPEFELLGYNQFESDTSVFNACPVFDDGKLLLRSDRYLYCIGQP